FEREPSISAKIQRRVSNASSTRSIMNCVSQDAGLLPVTSASEATACLNLSSIYRSLQAWYRACASFHDKILFVRISVNKVSNFVFGTNCPPIFSNGERVVGKELTSVCKSAKDLFSIQSISCIAA